MKYFLVLIMCIVFVSCEDKYNVVHTKSINAVKANSQSDTLISDSLDNSVFSRLYRPNSYGLIYRYQVPEKLKEKEIEIIFGGKIRTNYGFSNACINVSVGSKTGNTIGWTGRNLRYFFTDLNKWCLFKDSIKCKHESWQEPYFIINVFTFLGNSTFENFDIKDLEIQFKIKE